MDDVRAASRGGQSGMERLVFAVQELSLARDLETIMRIVRRVARELTGADGATFVLRDAGQCFYADEDAIGPLWKGKRFPIEDCISGWAMLNARSVTIEDIYADPRIPAEAYRPTFVKSLAMVPIRTSSPIGAIGNYWASHRKVTDEELRLLQALADSTSVAMENVALISSLEARVRERTEQLEVANRELRAFSYSVSHDLRAPLRTIEGFSRALEEDLAESGKLDDTTRDHLSRICASTSRMGSLIEDMLVLAKVSRAEMRQETLDLTAMAREVVSELATQQKGRRVEVSVDEGMIADGDPSLLRAVLDNLVGNAFKFTSRVAHARIEIGASRVGEELVFHVHDNGAGFDMKYSDRLFAPFQRLHAHADFPGTGVGLATVQRIVHRHGGRIWAESQPDTGTTFSFTLASKARAHAIVAKPQDESVMRLRAAG